MDMSADGGHSTLFWNVDFVSLSSAATSELALPSRFFFIKKEVRSGELTLSLSLIPDVSNSTWIRGIE